MLACFEIKYRPATTVGFLVAINLPRSLQDIGWMNQVQTTLRSFLCFQNIITAFSNIVSFYMYEFQKLYHILILKLFYF